ncbi:MAG: Asp23/Gls24 family envelope stress response protein [Clostridia bacterium]|nr:Asp23/Gls24 family envelope stress response protein [Clostridia bacterium]
MSVNTSNIYGKIVISDDVIAQVAGHAALDCYGVHELVSRKFTDSVAELFNRQPYGSGVKVTIVENKIYISIYAVLKYGVSIDAVSDSLRSAVKYKVEQFSGMFVRAVKIHVVGIKL